jgi:ribosomal protein S18 acetylase RimI-like enzyme
VKIRSYEPADEGAVIALWQACDLTRPWNDPHKDIARKLTTQADWFLVASEDVDGVDGAETIVASAMFGYDGHRGWVNYLAVAPQARGCGHARALMAAGEALLTAVGCPKLNLLIRSSNTGVLAFYQRLGYTVDETIGMGKRLIADV